MGNGGLKSAVPLEGDLLLLPLGLQYKNRKKYQNQEKITYMKFLQCFNYKVGPNFVEENLFRFRIMH